MLGGESFSAGGLGTTSGTNLGCGRVGPCLRPGRSATADTEKGLRRLRTSRSPSLAVLLPRRPKSTNPYTRSQENWRRWDKTALTYVSAAAVGLLGGVLRRPFTGSTARRLDLEAQQ